MLIIKNKNRGFTLVELLVVITIIGIIATISAIFLFGIRNQAGDTKRISDLNQIGRFLSFGCLTPASGPGEYDLNELIAEYKTRYPQYADNLPDRINDPKTGSVSASNYKYVVDNKGQCVLYANLEKEDSEVTLPSISAPLPGGGRGVFEAPAIGWNGSNKYYQISN